MRMLSGWIVAASLVAASMLSAQERRDPAARPAASDQARPAAGGAQGSRADQEIAAFKLLGCRNEVELAKLASQKSQNPEVKEFAAKMIKEHTDACAKLEQIAGPLAPPHHEGARPAPGGAPGAAPGTRRATPDRPAADRPAADRPAADRPAAATRPAPGADVEVQVRPGAQPGARPGADVTVRGGAGGAINWVSLHQEMADQCLASAVKEFGKKQGEEFDKCYIAGAIGSHQHTIDADHVFLNKVSQQFRGDIEEGLKMATAHLNLAKDIMQKLEGKSPRLAEKPEER